MEDEADVREDILHKNNIKASDILQYKLLVPMYIQFFAKDGPGGEKTEEPTSKKLDDARKEGQVAKSKDLVQSIELIGLFLLLKVYAGTLGEKCMQIFNYVYGMIPKILDDYYGLLTVKTSMAIIRTLTLKMAIIILPIFAVGFAIAFIGNLVQVKWKVTAKPMMPKLSKISPINGFKRMFSMRTLVETAKSIALIIIIMALVYTTIKDKLMMIKGLYNISLNQAIEAIGDMVITLGLKISMFYLVIGITDFVYQKRKHHKEMMMTKQEIKDEYKNTEGDPQIKGQIRRRMQEASNRRMMQAVPTADVVITNPTHFAVALRYDPDNGNAPVVVAKGEDYLAQKIKDKAREADVEIVENKPLARMLYFNVDVGAQIPPELYQAVAEVLAYVYKIKNK